MKSSSESLPNSIDSPAPVHGPTNPESSFDKIRRFAAVVEMKPEKERLYRELHADVWPGVVQAIKKANISNYSIFVASIERRRYLFSYFEYSGSDPGKDFASIAADPTTRDEWWPLTDACQQVLDGTPDGEQWLLMEQLMHIS